MHVTVDVVRELGYLTLGTRLRRLGERLQAQTQLVLEAHRLAVPAAQFPFLAALDRLGPLQVGALAAAVGVSQPATTRTVTQLTRAGLVATAVSAGDQRGRVVTLSRAGRRAVEQGKRMVWPVIEAAVRELCEAGSGSLLARLAALEDGLAAQSLEQRARAARARRR